MEGLGRIESAVGPYVHVCLEFLKVSTRLGDLTLAESETMNPKLMYAVVHQHQVKDGGLILFLASHLTHMKSKYADLVLWTAMTSDARQWIWLVTWGELYLV